MMVLLQANSIKIARMPWWLKDGLFLFWSVALIMGLFALHRLAFPPKRKVTRRERTEAAEDRARLARECLDHAARYAAEAEAAEKAGDAERAARARAGERGQREMAKRLGRR